jgi:hypothetical protein
VIYYSFIPLKEERSCRLHLVRDGQKIEVAVGTIYAGTVIHGRPVPPGHARVMVDDYAAGEDETLVPVPNDEVATLRLARSSFTAWPKDMISLDEVKMLAYKFFSLQFRN